MGILHKDVQLMLECVKVPLLVLQFSYNTLTTFLMIIWPCMEYCCHIWTDAFSCYLNLVDKLQKRICKRTFGPSLAASLEVLAHR